MNQGTGDSPHLPRVRPYLRAAVSPDVSTTSDEDHHGLGLRPFVLTDGRVLGVDPTIGIETQVTACPDGGSWTNPPVSRLSAERRGIVTLCAEPHSVAEISARLRLHLGVTRILVGDLRAAGYLDVHTSDTQDAHDPDTILRVIDGLRALS